MKRITLEMKRMTWTYPSHKKQGLPYAPVVQSDLKSTDYGSKFITNYLGNIPNYIKRVNQALKDVSVDSTKR